MVARDATGRPTVWQGAPPRMQGARVPRMATSRNHCRWSIPECPRVRTGRSAATPDHPTRNHHAAVSTISLPGALARHYNANATASLPTAIQRCGRRTMNQSNQSTPMTCHKCKRNECISGLKVCAACREQLRQNGMTNHHRQGYRQMDTGARPKRRVNIGIADPFSVSGPAGRHLAILNAQSGW